MCSFFFCCLLVWQFVASGCVFPIFGAVLGYEDRRLIRGKVGKVRTVRSWGPANSEHKVAPDSHPIWVFPKNRGTPKSSILIGFSLINHPFWGIPIFGNTHICWFSWGNTITHIQNPMGRSVLLGSWPPYIYNIYYIYTSFVFTYLRRNICWIITFCHISGSATLDTTQFRSRKHPRIFIRRREGFLETIRDVLWRVC